MTDRISWPWAEERDYGWMTDVIYRVLPSTPTEPNLMKWWAMDNRYWLPSPEDFERLLAWDPTSTWEYLSDRFDCESFAFGLQSHFVERVGLNCVGVVLDYSAVDAQGNPAPHAYNLVVFGDGSWKWLEPQSDQYVETGTGLYTCKQGMVLL